MIRTSSLISKSYLNSINWKTLSKIKIKCSLPVPYICDHIDDDSQKQAYNTYYNVSRMIKRIVDDTKRNIWRIPDELRDNKQFVLELVKQCGPLMSYASDRLKYDRQVNVAALKEIRDYRMRWLKAREERGEHRL